MTMLIFYVLLALGVSFVCSVLEAIILSVTPGFIQTEIAAGKGYAKHLGDMKGNLDKPISAILTLNTIAHTMGAAGAGAQWKVISHDTGEAVFAGALTFLVLVFSEIIPKTIGAKFWRGLAGPATTLLRLMVKVMTVLGILPALSLITKLVGGEPESHGVSRSELAAMAQLSLEAGHLDKRESNIVHNLFLLRSSKVRDIMTPRIVVFTQPAALAVDEFLANTMHKPFSRIPIYGENKDDITGFVLKSEVMAAQIRGEAADATLESYRRPLLMTPSTASVYQVFQTMSRERAHLMLVVSEFGEMEGVVSMEDVVETLLGLEIVDEVDRTEDMQKVARRLWKLRAAAMGLTIEDEELDSQAISDAAEESKE